MYERPYYTKVLCNGVAIEIYSTIQYISRVSVWGEKLNKLYTTYDFFMCFSLPAS